MEPGTAPQAQTPPVPGTQGGKRLKVVLVSVLFILLTAIVLGLMAAFSFSGSPVGFGWFVFSFAMGLTMIVLPCTLPLAFVIVPLSMGKGAVRGLLIALAFSLGVAITLSFYGVLAALLGEVAIGGLGAPLEVVKNWLYAVAGLFAIVFALGELGLLKVRMPSYSGSAPMFIQKQQEIIKAFLLGLFMGNIGVGCPHPATPLILTRIAASGDVFYGWLLFLVNAIGRVMPLMFLAILGILGVNGISFLLKHKEKITRATGWMMVFVGGFLFTLGFFTHDWWVYSGLHSLLELVTQEERFIGIISGQLRIVVPHAHGLAELVGKTGLLGAPLWLGNWVLIFLWTAPLWFTWWKERQRIHALPEAEQKQPHEMNRLRALFFGALTVVIAGGVLWTSHWFIAHKGLEMEMEEPPAFQLRITAPPVLEAGVPQELVIEFKDENGKPLTSLEVSHERLVHAVIISEDLETLGHVHAEDIGLITEEMKAAGRYTVRYTFPLPGREYLVAVDTIHEGHEAALYQRVKTSGASSVPVIVKDLSRTKTFDGYATSFEYEPSPLKSGEEAHLRYRFEKGSAPVDDLEPYLAATTHLSIVSVDLGTFIHTHGDITPEISALPGVSEALASGVHEEEEGHNAAPPAKFGPYVTAHVIFPHPGLYKIFSQVQHQGKVIVTSFMVVVEPGEDGAEAMP